MMTREYFNQFDLFIIFSPSFNYDPLWRHFIAVGKPIRHFMIIDEATLSNMLDVVKKDGRNYKILVVLDDMSGNKSITSRVYSPAYEELVNNCRWMNTSIIHSSQRVALTSTSMRENCEALIITTLPSLREIKLLEDFMGTDKLENFRRLVNECTKKPYNFLYIKRQPTLTYYWNFRRIPNGSY